MSSREREQEQLERIHRFIDHASEAHALIVDMCAALSVYRPTLHKNAALAPDAVRLNIWLSKADAYLAAVEGRDEIR